MKRLCEAYGARFLQPGSSCANLYQKLLDHSFHEQPRQAYKKTSITAGGQPLIFSLKYGKDSEPQRLRTVMEPGGNSLTPSQQVDYCLHVLNEVIEQEGWRIDADLNRILPIIYPTDAEDTAEWVSGMWIGMDSGDALPAWKLYLPLRFQPDRERWQKVADCLVLYSCQDMEPTFRTILAVTGREGHPLGIGCGVCPEGLQGIRVYITFGKSCQAYFRELCAALDVPGGAEGEAFFTAANLLAGSGPSSVLAVDFVRDKSGWLRPKPYRIKAEANFCNMDREQQSSIFPFFSAQMASAGFDAKKFENDWAIAKQYFPELKVQYCSVGVGSSPHFSLYFEP